MLYKGKHFRRSRQLVSMPTRDGLGQLMPYVEPDKENYVVFGRVAKAADAPGAVQTAYTYLDSGKPVFAVPIPITGYSLTNMAYGRDGRMYLMKDGHCYQTAV